MLRVDGIDLFYGASRALRGVSLGADPGRITCVLGRNGVGKSSLMRAIVGLERIKAGRIVWEGKDVSGLSAADRARAGIGYVPQGREIFPFLTVKENLETALAAAPCGSRLPEDIFELFPILKQFLRRRGGDLSGGQQQQLAIARALTARPRLLILDEPTEGIQPNVIKDIARVIALLARQRNMAVVLVEQYYEFARELGDELAILVRGEVALAGASGTLDEEAVRRLLTV
jgi:urea transport system ATP-binding protein